jgi:hypothetical protein
MTEDIIRPTPSTPSYIRGHEHKYFMFQVKQVFEPQPDTDNTGLYKMVEYGYLSCNCGETVKSKVRIKEDDK